MDRSLPQLTNLTEQVEKQKLSAETLIKEKEQEIRDLKGTVSQQSQESTGLKAEVEDKTQENEKLKQEIEKLKEEITEKKREIVKLEKEIEDKTRESEKLEQENEELKEKITEKKREIVKLEKEIEDKTRENEKLEQENEELKEKITEKKREIVRLEKEIEDKTRENEKLEQENEKLKEKITEKKREIVKLEKEIEDKTRENENLERQITDKTGENVNLKKEITAMRLENEALNGTIRDKSKQLEDSRHKLNILAVGLFVLCAVLVFQLPLPFSYLKFQQISEPNKLTRQTVDAFRSQLNIWKQQFPNQNQVFWSYVQARSKSHLTTDVPSRPLVFAIAASKNTSELSRCFGKKLGHVLSANARQVESINASDYETRNDQEAEEELGETIKSHLSTAPAGAVVIDHLELLPSKMAFIFFSYCDNEDAPFPYASFIFIVHGKETSLESMEPLEAEEKVKSFLLDEVWSTDTHGPSAVAALVSRVADVIIVPSEDSTVNC